MLFSRSNSHTLESQHWKLFSTLIYVHVKDVVLHPNELAGPNTWDTSRLASIVKTYAQDGEKQLKLVLLLSCSITHATYTVYVIQHPQQSFHLCIL